WRGASLQPSSEMVSRASSGKRRMRKAPGLGCAKYRGQRTLFVVLAAAGEERAAWVAHRQAHEPTGETRTVQDALVVIDEEPGGVVVVAILSPGPVGGTGLREGEAESAQAVVVV